MPESADSGLIEDEGPKIGAGGLEDLELDEVFSQGSVVFFRPSGCSVDNVVMGC